MDNIRKNPLKLYIQDIFRANTTDNKYIYELFGLKFKNIMIHGVVTNSVYNPLNKTMNLELSDVTGSIQVYYDSTKNNTNVPKSTLQDLKSNYIDASKFGDANIGIISNLMERVIDKQSVVIEEGCHLHVVGDIFVDSLKNIRMVSAYECSKTSVDNDVVWMEELRYLYDKFYLKN